MRLWKLTLSHVIGKDTCQVGPLHSMKAYVGVEIYRNSLFTSELDVMNGQVLDLAALSPAKDLLCPIYRRLGGPRSRSGGCGEFNCC